MRRKEPPIVTYPPDPPDPIDWGKAARLFERLGSYRAVAEEIGCSASTVSKYLRALGVRRQPPLRTDRASHMLYGAWRTMIRRCTNKSDRGYGRYGGRGIRVHRSWQSFEAFRAWSLRNGWRDGLCLVLRDPDRDFEPTNCRWVTRPEALKLRTRVASLTDNPVAAFGETKSAWAWARNPRCRVTYVPLLRRLSKCWQPEVAITTPPREGGPKRGAKGRGGRKSIYDWRKITELYQDGRSCAEIARSLGIPLSTIYGGLAQRRVVQRRKHRNIAHDPLHGVWRRMQSAGEDQGSIPTLHRAWRNFERFREWAHRNGYRGGRFLVRLDPWRPFGPGNCRFVSAREKQQLFTEAPASAEGPPRWRVRAFGECKGPTEWSRDRRCDVTLTTLLRRLRDGWSPEEAIAWPPENVGSRGHGRVLITAFGETMSVSDWIRDRRCALLSKEGLLARIRRGVRPEDAITVQHFQLGRSEQRARGRRTGRRAP